MKKQRRPQDSQEVPDAAERCMNPWNKKCSNTDIVLYIMFNGKRLPICHKCWEEISSKDIEWRYT
ncbi:hypothetical protein DRO35_01420 [Candidatus Bathyarchaeota archaeon]|nr:MAG: hypothetical protein DRO35_01420 [Candidatus Bathyarchaeota archaeon]